MKISYKNLLMAGFASLALTAASSAADAALLNGSFSFEVFQGDTNSGNINDPTQQADLANPLLLTPSVASGTYTGNFDFFAAGSAVNNNINYFLTHGNGGVANGGILSLIGNGAAVLSSGGFDLTTVFKFTFAGDPFEYLGSSITHDDGVSLYNSILGTVLSAPGPVSETTSTLFNYGGAWTLIYVAANDLPEILRFEYESKRGRLDDVPLPAALPLLAAGLGGLGVLGRMRRRKTAA